METPVAFFIYRRPATTARVFERIAQAKPRRLLVVSDGPKNEEEAVLVEQCRSIATQVNWPCEVETHFAETNMGCRNRMSSGLDWVFSRCEEAIILEDDTLVDASFFPFSETMLERYREEPRVMQICALNSLEEWKSDRYSYFFGHNEGIWGWATWRRAWQRYDVEMRAWVDPAVKERMRIFLNNEDDYKECCQVFDNTYAGKIDTWDFQWSFAQFLYEGLSVLPSLNLVDNIGFGPDATHTTTPDWRTGRAARALSQPFIGPEKIEIDWEWQAAMSAHSRRLSRPPKRTLGRRILGRIRRLLSQ